MKTTFVLISLLMTQVAVAANVDCEFTIGSSDPTPFQFSTDRDASLLFKTQEQYTGAPYTFMKWSTRNNEVSIGNLDAAGDTLGASKLKLPSPATFQGSFEFQHYEANETVPALKLECSAR